MVKCSAIERLHMMSQHSNSLATATAAILVHNENLLRLCTKAKGCMQMLYREFACKKTEPSWCTASVDFHCALK